MENGRALADPRASRANEQMRQEAAATGELPLAYMLRIMRDPSQPKKSPVSSRMMIKNQIFKFRETARR
jgi:hypothetical protein